MKKLLTLELVGLWCMPLILACQGYAHNANSRSMPLSTPAESAGLEQNKSIPIQGSEVIIIAPNRGQFNFRKQRKTTDLTPIFGEPTRIDDFYYEMDDMWVKKWIYPGAYFLITTKRFDIFNIKEPGFRLSLKGAILEVEPVDALAGAFPDFNKYVRNNRYVPFTFLMPTGELSDEYITIQFDPITRKVTWMHSGML